MAIFKLVVSLIALANKFAGVIRRLVLRQRIRKEFENEGLARQTAILRRAWRARMARRNADRRNPAKRLQDDGFRRD